MDQTNIHGLDVYFDKRLACPVPHEFPVQVEQQTDIMRIEECDEEVADDLLCERIGKYSATEQDKICPLQTRHYIPTERKTCHQDQKYNKFKDRAVTETTEQCFVKFDILKYDSRESRAAADNDRDDAVACRDLLQEEDLGINSDSLFAGSEKASLSPRNEETEEAESSGSETDLSDTDPLTAVKVPKPQLEEVSVDSGYITPDSIGGEPITVNLAKELKTAVFGDSDRSFNDQWKSDRIAFRQNSYEIRFYKDGAVGVLACLQGYVLKHVLFESSLHTQGKPVNKQQQDDVLALTIGSTLWKIGEENSATIVLCYNCRSFSEDIDFKEDGITEKLRIFQFYDKSILTDFCLRHLYLFENTFGCILFLYSAILSRTVSKIYSDLGDGTPLLDENCVASQALLNLLLTGNAVPYCFNGNLEMLCKNGSGKIKLMHGITNRSEIGFLSQEEAIDPKKYEVGSRLKTPCYPIWIAKVGGQFYVLHSKRRGLLNDWWAELFSVENFMCTQYYA